MGLFSKKKTVTLQKGDVVFVLSERGFELYMDEDMSKATPANYYAIILTWLLTSKDSDARLLWQAIERKVNDHLDKFEETEKYLIERNKPKEEETPADGTA